ncbi:TIGR04141 family sporadically distributed protein [Streptomyces radicis]|uniref:TIGR04141 family sporadically distributed protein n=1 Tax=Streptomyces radicis TaxID=1750517 RepID=UPI001E4FCB66
MSLGSRRFFLLDGEWYETDPAYLISLQEAVRRLIRRRPSLDLPAWLPGQSERAYNEAVPDARPGFLCFDRDTVRTAFHRGNGVEVCDLLAPDGTLVMVKRAGGSGPLSHLFGQGVVAVQTLLNSPEARGKFARAAGLPPDFRPTKVVFAVLLKGHADLTPSTLYPFSRITLVHTARTLESWGVEVEVIGIRQDTATESGAVRAA